MSHEHERAFSASLISLGLGAVAALTIQIFHVHWLDPLGDAKVVEHVAEAGANDGLAAPLVLLGAFVAEQGGTGWLGEWRRGGHAFVAWFGVRGVGTLYYAATVVTGGALAGGEERVVAWTAIACVIVSIVVHGVTAGPAVRRLLAPVRQPRAREPATSRAR